MSTALKRSPSRDGSPPSKPESEQQVRWETMWVRWFVTESPRGAKSAVWSLVTRRAPGEGGPKTVSQCSLSDSLSLRCSGPGAHSRKRPPPPTLRPRRRLWRWLASPELRRGTAAMCANGDILANQFGESEALRRVRRPLALRACSVPQTRAATDAGVAGVGGGDALLALVRHWNADQGPEGSG